MMRFVLLVLLAFIGSAHAQPALVGPCMNNVSAGCSLTAPVIAGGTFSGITLGGSITATGATITGGTISGTDLGLGVLTPTGGTTTRTMASRATDPGFSVLEKGAKCDGVTDDTAAITAALGAGYQRVTVPDGRTCFSSTGITVPAGVTLAGMSFSPNNPPSGSKILCNDATAARCVTVGVGALTPSRVDNLVVACNATGTPTCTAVYVDRAYNVTLSRVMAYDAAIGYYWKAAGSAGLGGKMIETYSGKIADAHIVQDSWPELSIDNSRFGMNGSGDLNATAFIRITGGDPTNPNGTGPNGLRVTDTQFNQGNSTTVAYWLQFVNCGGTCIGGASPVNATEFSFSQIHVEAIGTAFITSDATWNAIALLGISADSAFIQSNKPFWALNAATGLTNVRINGGFINAHDFTLAPTPQFNDVAITGTNIEGAVSITSASVQSTLGFSNNTVTGNLTFAGAWKSLSAHGGDIRGGVLTTSGATGNIAVSIPNGYADQSIEYTTPGSYTYTLGANYRFVRIKGCGWGGPGGSGAVQANNAASSGGASGGAGLCLDQTYPASTVAANGISVTIGAAPVAGTAVTASVATAGVDGTRGVLSLVFTGAVRLMNLYPGGAGSGGQLAQNSGGGASAGLCGAGGNGAAATGGVAGCGGGIVGGNGVAGGNGAGGIVGASGGGSSGTTGVSSIGAIAPGLFNAASSGAGGGTTALGAANNAGAGGLSANGMTQAAAGIVSAVNGGNAATPSADVPGPGAGGGYGGPVSPAGNGGNGSQGDSGAGGGSCVTSGGTPCTSGAGGQGGASFVKIIPLP